jgi:hypothetical protein
LLKLDSFLQIQLGSVYRGLSRVSDEEVQELYGNRFIPIAYVEGEKGNVSKNEMQLTLSDSIASVMLRCDVNEL